jgi:hypothetical protein
MRSDVRLGEDAAPYLLMQVGRIRPSKYSASAQVLSIRLTLTATLMVDDKTVLPRNP